MTKIRKGLTLPIKGQPKPEVDRNKSIKSVAILGSDYQGMKPTMLVKEGDEVKVGQTLFECKRQVGVKYTAPAAGKVVSINRGPKRVFESLVIQVASSEEQVEFTHYKKSDLDKIDFEKVKKLLQESGLWTAIRMRPFSKNPAPESRPKALFITAMDTNPLSGNPASVINDYKEDFKNGVKVLSKLTEGKTYVCHAKGESLPVDSSANVVLHGFEG
ncbi:MAG: NADH:ubiquinone reductase (Na(+)-transporting) subunit A, partial [Bdellovibrionota bacterium]|nr:NADH:ubiquinone reductase (Na(+)-transporting) subunit A [Bdellovibrionota bacterium]